jgi:hypothetical protein
VVVAWIVFYVVAMPFAGIVYRSDPNSGFRLALSRDAMVGVIDSAGLGVGYGKEVITGRYSQYGFDTSLLTASDEQLAREGVHNSLTQEFLRLGVAGGAFLGWLVLVSCFPPRMGSPRLRRHLAAVYLFLIIAVTLNVALESPTYIVGVAFAIAYLLVAKDALTSNSTSDTAAPSTRRTADRQSVIGVRHRSMSMQDPESARAHR